MRIEKGGVDEDGERIDRKVTEVEKEGGSVEKVLRSRKVSRREVSVWGKENGVLSSTGNCMRER